MNIIFPTNISELRECPFDFHELEMKIRKFFLCLQFSGKNVRYECLDARNYLDSVRINVRNLISFEENKYVQTYSKAYFWMIENLGRVDLKLDEIEEEFDRLEKTENHNHIDLSKSHIIRKYINSLLVVFEHLVYHPLKNSLKKFKKDTFIDGKIVEKDYNLFAYYLFFELKNSSESLGAISSITKSTPQRKGESITYNQYASKDDADQYSIPELPKNIKVKEHIKVKEQKEEDKNKLEIQEELFEDEDEDEI